MRRYTRSMRTFIGTYPPPICALRLARARRLLNSLANPRLLLVRLLFNGGVRTLRRAESRAISFETTA